MEKINILFEMKNLHFMYNIIELKNRIKIKNCNYYLKFIDKNNKLIICYNKNYDFVNLFKINNICYLNVNNTKNNILFDKIINEDAYFKELTHINDSIFTIKNCDEDFFFKEYKQYEISSKNRLNLIPSYNKKINVVGIFDEMFYNSIKHLFNITLCSNNPNYVIPKNTDLFIVESCWNGNNGMFKTIIFWNKTILINLLNKCKNRNIPTIFINKEDYINYKRFINTAKLFDYIFTTDINCIDKYKKDCPNAKGIYNTNFFINIMDITQNCINKKYDNNILFAGSYTFCNHGTRNEDMCELFDICINNNLKLNIIDRNSKNNTINIYPNKYAKYLYDSVSYKDLINDVYNNYEYILNLNSVSNSETMFARRIIESLAQRKIVISNYSPAIEKYFKNIIFYKEDISKLKNLSFIEKEIIKHNGFLQVYNYFSDKIFYNKFLKCLNFLNFKHYIIPDYNPKVSIICVIKDKNNIKNIIETFNKQNYKNKELLLCIKENNDVNNLNEFVEKKNDIKVITLNSEYSKDYCLNELIKISNGEIIQKMKDSDYYSENFISNQIIMYDIYNADLVGKSLHFLYVKTTNKLYVNNYNYNTITQYNYIIKNTVSFKKKNEFKFCNGNLIITNKKNKFISSSLIDYCNIIYNEQKIKNKEKYNCIGKYISIPYNIINGKI
ncbi:hypothetical protein CL656_00120 [bacterium]|nr:hypothetical protein [bacterium]